MDLKKPTNMHPTQRDILNSLRHAESRQFSELLLDVAETSDNLTYHLRRLQKNGFIESPEKGRYILAEKGLMYLNNNLELEQDIFPTVSCMLELYGPNDEALVMRKLKQPNLGDVHLPTFGVDSSKTLTIQVKDFLNRYHIAASNLTFRCLHRERVRNEDGQVFFDKFFVVFQGRFKSYDQHIDDREFFSSAVSKLVEDPRLLGVSKAVLSPTASAAFVEHTWRVGE